MADDNAHLADEHQPSIPGYDDAKKLAEAIGNARYDFVEELFTHLANKFQQDHVTDAENDRTELASHLYRAGIYLDPVIREISDAWDISEPYETTDK